jgi:hypothetical protein
MPRAQMAPESKEGLTVKAHPGDGSVLLGFNLETSHPDNLAGFSIKRTSPDGKAEFLPNRLSFGQPVTKKMTVEQQHQLWTPSDQAPFQKFHWVDFPSSSQAGTYHYSVTAMFFDSAGKLTSGPTTTTQVDVGTVGTANCKLGFTRGYLSSQAYATLFQNKPFEPARPKGGNVPIAFDTKPFEAQYAWLGFHARKMVFDFLNDCVQKCKSDQSFSVDVFAYDLNEPDFIRGLQALGKQLRIVSDDSKTHVAATTGEAQARALLAKATGSANLKVGHYKRFAHDKIIILKKNGNAIRVLTGSANFSIRGLYVQANSVLLIDSPDVAQLYEKDFQQAFTGMSGAAKSDMAAKWFPFAGMGLPKAEVSFAPHTNASVSLDTVASAIRNAKSSVLFAVMELQGGGPVLQELQKIHSAKKIFSYGVTQNLTGMRVFKPDSGDGLLVPFSFLSHFVPEPFVKEWNGGMGQVIHHKFVVVDFNDATPVVFAGSSNLSKGGEESNGDNLYAIHDPAFAQAYAVEAIRLVEHYHFRSAIKTASDAAPLKLQTPDDLKAGKGKKQAPWWQPYYDPKNIQFSERTLFAK